ncbi:MAG: mechanosensitive ion channel family protein [Thaumarchaeota archaeon]|nr:mechanosensitive ion channel family protein [Nitrososphaerota archaeon]
MAIDLLATDLPTLVGRYVIGLAITVIVVEVLLRTATKVLKHYGGATRGIRSLAYATVAVFILLPVAREFFPDPTIALYSNITQVLVVGFLGYRIFNRILGNLSSKLREVGGTHFYTSIFIPVRKIGNGLILVLILLSVVNVSGVDLSPFLLGWGFALFVFALAIQGILGDVVAGLYILIARPFRVGDVVQFPSGEVCEIVDIKDQRTVLRNLVSTELIDQSNLDLLKIRLVRLDGREGVVTIPAKVKVAKAKDVQKARSLLMNLAGLIAGKSANPTPKVFLLEISESVAKFEVVLHLTDLSLRREVLDRFNTGLVDALESEGLTFG